KELEEESGEEKRTLNKRSATLIAVQETPIADVEISEEDEDIDAVNANTAPSYTEESSSNAATIDKATFMTSLDWFLVLEPLCELDEEQKKREKYSGQALVEKEEEDKENIDSFAQARHL
ncbi:unnamed protein product, partial [Hymenolepis diminuta]